MMKAVLLFGAETRALIVALSQKLNIVHVVFMRKVRVKKMQRLRNDAHRKVAVDIVLQAIGIQSLKTYIGNR